MISDSPPRAGESAGSYFDLDSGRFQLDTELHLKLNWKPSEAQAPRLAAGLRARAGLREAAAVCHWPQVRGHHGHGAAGVRVARPRSRRGLAPAGPAARGLNSRSCHGDSDKGFREWVSEDLAPTPATHSDIKANGKHTDSICILLCHALQINLLFH
jgi:hypothetical protein